MSPAKAPKKRPRRPSKAVKGLFRPLSRNAAALGALEAIKDIVEHGLPKPGTLKPWAARMARKAFP